MPAPRESLDALLRDLQRALHAGDDEGARRLTRAMAVLLSGLPAASDMGTIGDVEASLSRGAAISAGRTKAPTRMQQLMQERGLSLPELWEALPTPRPALETLKAWTKPGAGGRKVPRKWAQKLAKYFGDASLLDDDSWPRGIR